MIRALFGQVGIKPFSLSKHSFFFYLQQWRTKLIDDCIAFVTGYVKFVDILPKHLGRRLAIGANG